MKRIKNELVAFKVPTPINKKIEKFAELEMISKSDLIRRSVFAEFSKLDEKFLKKLSMILENLISF